MDKEQIDIIRLQSGQTFVELLDQLVGRIRVIFGDEENILAGVRIILQPTADSRF